MKPLAWCLSLVLVTVMAPAQVRESVTVEVIEVPVYVFAPDGQPIRGLTRDKFELRINGRQKPIDFFDPIDLSTAPSSAAETPRPARERRLYLLLFDLHFSTPGKLARAQRAAEYAVEHSNAQTDLFSVATHSAVKGVQIVTPFLSDRVAIRRALETLSPGKMHDPLGLAMSSAERLEWTSEPEDSSSGFRTGRKDDEVDVSSLMTAAGLKGESVAQQMQHAQDDRTVENLFGDFGDLADRLSGLEGQKHILYFSEGSGLVIRWNDPSSARTVQILYEMFRRFAAAGVFVDILDIAGLRATDNPPQFAPPPPTYRNPSAARSLDPSVHEALAAVARGTGGDFVHNRNDFANALDDLTKSQQVAYILGFHRRDNHDGTIDVRVHGVPRGSRLSFRQGFGAASRSKDVDPLQLADILINDIPQSGVNISIDYRERELVVELPRAEIVPQLVEKSPAVETVLYVFDQGGSAVVAKQRTITLPAAEREGKEPIAIRQPLDLPAGRYVAKVVARIAGTASVGFARREFTVISDTDSRSIPVKP